MDAPHWWAVNWPRYGCAIAAVAAAATFGAPTAALAQDYPTRPIRLVVVTAAGGLMDVAARVTAEHVGKALGQKESPEQFGVRIRRDHERFRDIVKAAKLKPE